MVNIYTSPFHNSDCILIAVWAFIYSITMMPSFAVSSSTKTTLWFCWIWFVLGQAQQLPELSGASSSCRSNHSISNAVNCSAFCSSMPEYSKSNWMDQVATYHQPHLVVYHHTECDCLYANQSASIVCQDWTLLLNTSQPLDTCTNKNITTYIACQTMCNTLGQQVTFYQGAETSNSNNPTTICSCRVTNVCSDRNTVVVPPPTTQSPTIAPTVTPSPTHYGNAAAASEQVTSSLSRTSSSSSIWISLWSMIIMVVGGTAPWLDW